MSAKHKTVLLDVEKLKAGDTIEFTATAKVISMCAANDDEPTLSDNIYVLAVVGDSGLYNGRKVKVKVRKGEKVSTLYRKPWTLRAWEYLHSLLLEARKP